MQLFTGILSYQGLPFTPVFGVREERAGEYHTDLWVDLASLDPSVVDSLCAIAQKEAFDMDAQPWRAFLIEFDDGRKMEVGLYGWGSDLSREDFLHFMPMRSFVGPPCPMTNERYYRIQHPSLGRRRDSGLETIPYPDPPAEPVDWLAVFEAEGFGGGKLHLRSHHS